MSNEQIDKAKKPSEPLLDFNRAARKCQGMAKLAELREKLGMPKRDKS